MLWLACFLGLGVVGNALCTAIGTRLALGHLLPDCALLVTVWISQRREPLSMAVAAVTLGTVLGRDSLAPAGLQPTALLLVAMGCTLLAGNLTSGGRLFFALTCGVAAVVHQALLFVLLRLSCGHAGFASWACATLVLSGACTALLALLGEPLLRRLDQALSPKKTTGLLWRS